MTEFGQNVGYVDELYRRFLDDPASVGPAWREFFEGYHPPGGPPGPPATGPRAEDASPAGAIPLRGAQARLAANMEGSLEIPTATSVRTVPVKCLEENRRILNQHQATRRASKISFTHLVAWAVVRALDEHPAMNAAYADVEGVPHRVARREVNLGLAVDTERKGERALVVPNVKGAEALDFPAFIAACDAVIAQARAGTLLPDAFAGTTLSITNPGTIGTTLSVPRLMPGQGTIVGTGAIGYPPEYSGLAEEAAGNLGLSKVMTLSSTYDHRIIQGAESGAFLARIERLLQGDDRFYERIYEELGVPQEPVRVEAGRAGTGDGVDAVTKQAGALQLVRSFRVRGHLSAHLDPLGSPPLHQDELELAYHGLSVWDLDRRFTVGVLAGSPEPRPLREILDILRETYCRYVGVEFMHIQELPVRRWLEGRMEPSRNAAPLSSAEKARILASLNAAEAFEKFLHGAYIGQKRFSLEGGETLLPMLDAVLSDAAEAGIGEAVLGMSHRGRLNILSNVVGKSLASIFREFEGEPDPAAAHGSGDVKYHLGASGIYTAPSGRSIAVTLAPNPSHLEAVDPVVEGMVRAKQDRLDDLVHERVLPILMHGDAAFAGQGVVAETLNLSQLRGFRTGGTVHIVVNNQIGFTTSPQDARSSPYATDVARMVQAPIFHVNGDHPEAAVRVARLALEFRSTFKRDVVVDLVCYRRWGHNEGDDPSYTHPRLYAAIEAKRSVRKLYTEELLRRGDLTPDDAERSLDDYRTRLEAAFETSRALVSTGATEGAEEETESAVEPAAGEVRASIPPERLEEILAGLDRVPEAFEIHPKLARQIQRRRDRFHAGEVDWSLAEALAFGSLVLEGTPVRLSGEDSARGTFSQRHAVLFDRRTGAGFTPLASLAPDQARFQVFDSLLSEFAVLGFEYGYSVSTPQALVLWEAQFGDFANGAQVVIDQFIASAEEKWGLASGVTLLLPHGYEGQGPEHSSARLERFLQLCAGANLRVCIPSTPAQYFHLLRRQANAARKPLVALTPKSLLRLREATSTPQELSRGSFATVLDDASIPDPSSVRRVVLCAGKVAYDLASVRGSSSEVAIVRLEQIYPFPDDRIAATLARYTRAGEFVWAQEEPRNMGAWGFLDDRLHASIPRGRPLRFAGRSRHSSPATGSHKRHAAEQDTLVREALRGARSEAARAHR